jgi:hypothetical protein
LEEEPPREIPAAWVEDRGDIAADIAPPEAPLQTPSHGVGDVADPAPSAGTLAFSAGGRPFGRETYELREEATDGWVLESRGVFEFRVVIATVRVPFTQTLHMDRELRPTSYALHVDGVMGFGAQNVTTEIREGRAVVTVNEETTEVAVDAGRTFILGTFSSYALLPRLAAAGEDATYDLFVFGGPPHESRTEAAEMRIGRAREATIRSADVILEVDAYPVTTGFGESMLLAKDGEFIGLLADAEEEGEEGLLVYRADYFPDGFELIP